jgi:hypothetical protein
MAYPYSWSGPFNTGSILPGWTQAGGTWTNGTNGFGPTTSTDNGAVIYTGSGNLANQHINITGNDFYAASGTTYSTLNIILRSQDPNDFNNAYALNFYGVPNNQANGQSVRLFKVVGGVVTQIGSAQGWFLPQNGVNSPSPFSIDAFAVGNQIGYAVNGVVMYPTDWVDSTYSTGEAGIYNSATAGTSAPYITSVTIDGNIPSPTPTAQICTRQTGNPLIAKGTTYDGLVGANLQSAKATWDATANEWIQWVGNWTGSVWCAFIFTSPDFKTWTYVAGSRQSPTSPNTIVGGAGIVRVIGGTYNGQFAQVAYPDNTPALFPICLYVSTTLTGFTSGSPNYSLNTPTSASCITKGTNDANGQVDCSIANQRNPISGNYEIVYGGIDASGVRRLMLASTPDFVTFSTGAVILDTHSGTFDPKAFLGAPTIGYMNGPDGSSNARYIMWDARTYSSTDTSPNTYRCKGVAWQKYLGSGTWGTATILPSPSLYSNKANSWELAAVCDGAMVGLYDIGDGNGIQMRLLYCGNAQADLVAATQSGVGGAFFSQPQSSLVPMFVYTEQTTLQRPTLILPYD